MQRSLPYWIGAPIEPPGSGAGSVTAHTVNPVLVE